jgi:hypothetical protein
MTEAPTPIDTAVPLDLHPDALLPHAATFAPADMPGRMGLDLGRAALAEMHDSYRKIAHAARAIQETEHSIVSTPAGLRVGRADLGPLVEAAKVAFDRTARAVDTRLTALAGEHAELSKRLEATLVEPSRSAAGIAQAGEVRTHLRSLGSPAKAMAVAMEALQAGDRVTAAAVLTAPPYLSGLDAAKHEELRKLAASMLEPKLDTAMTALDKITDHVRRATQSYVGMYAKVAKAANAGPSNRVRAALRELHDAA